MTERTRAAASGAISIGTAERGRHRLKGLPECSLHAALELGVA
jgi:hypothetical protein